MHFLIICESAEWKKLQLFLDEATQYCGRATLFFENVWKGVTVVF